MQLNKNQDKRSGIPLLLQPAIICYKLEYRNLAIQCHNTQIIIDLKMTKLRAAILRLTQLSQPPEVIISTPPYLFPVAL